MDYASQMPAGHSGNNSLVGMVLFQQAGLRRTIWGTKLARRSHGLTAAPRPYNKRCNALMVRANETGS